MFSFFAVVNCCALLDLSHCGSGDVLFTEMPHLCLYYLENMSCELVFSVSALSCSQLVLRFDSIRLEEKDESARLFLVTDDLLDNRRIPLLNSEALFRTLPQP